MRAYIYVGGEIDPPFIHEKPDADALTIAADCGWHNAAALGVVPQILLGDFDSIGGGELPPAKEILQVPAEKDRTDTQLAVDLALSRGAQDIVVIGGLSGRLDHTLSNLSLLERLFTLRVPAVMTDGRNRVRFIRNSGALVARSDFPYLSLLVADEIAKGVTVRGCKYELKNEKLTRECQFAVSNEITGNCALIEVRKGGLYIVESR